MWRRWLVDRPVVEWWILNWVLSMSLKIIKSVNSVNNDISLSKIFISLHSVLMWWGWLVNRPVVEWWVLNWVLHFHIFLLISINLGKSNSNWSWFVSDQILQISSCYVSVHKLEKTISITLISLSKSNGDWCWLVGDKVLEVSSGDVSIHNLEEAISITLLSKGNG